jgi:hypothetical protein
MSIVQKTYCFPSWGCGDPSAGSLAGFMSSSIVGNTRGCTVFAI